MQNKQGLGKMGKINMGKILIEFQNIRIYVETVVYP